MKLILVLLILLTGCTAIETLPIPETETLTISYTPPQWENESGYITLYFEVQNTSPMELKYIKIIASFYDKNDQLVRSESPAIEHWRGLASNQRSPATVMTRSSSRIRSVRLTFTGNKSGSKTVSLKATQVAKLFP